MKLQKPFVIDKYEILPGEKKFLEIPIPSLYSQAKASMPVYIKHGKEAGETILITAAIHGDEINGIEIIRRLFNSKKINNIKGTIIAIPVVNIYGLFTLSRYLPDRRDLNRSFPGNVKGSLAAKLAHILTSQLLPKVNCIIDLHTAAVHRDNLPQIRTNVSCKKCKKLAKAFGAYIVINANVRDGSLRQEASDLKIPILVYEAGEALRFNESAIRIGLNGIINVLSCLKMINKKYVTSLRTQTAMSTSWLRAPYSGLLYLTKKLGSRVTKKEIIGQIFDPFLATNEPVIANKTGIIIGKTNLPLVIEGDAIANIALTDSKQIIETEQIDLEQVALDNFLN